MTGSARVTKDEKNGVAHMLSSQSFAARTRIKNTPPFSVLHLESSISQPVAPIPRHRSAVLRNDRQTIKRGSECG